NKVYQARQVGKYKAKYNDMEAFYQKFWNSQSIHKCFECGEHLSSYKNWHIHHIAVKKKYPELSSNLDVCVLLCLGCHMNYHNVALSKIEELFP
ncbi:HNH endonuclease, partial [Clostridium perfringens]|nr:HNH endonuclease [Clostridium perfringens]